ncbi:MAG: MerR family transcriptional regulator [Paracoccaceae bacterium]|nr:MerR family transcriptional regulator [Paracoccaceae bacterium]
MLTRTEFQNATGLTRKALRVYEEKRLLQPQEDSRRQAFYQSKDVDRAVLIRLLRQAGIPVSQIQSYLAPPSVQELSTDSTEDQLRVALEKVARTANEALDRLDAYSRSLESSVRRLRYGGMWAWGRAADISQSHVARYVADFVKELDAAGLPSDRVAARYENERADRVSVTCYTEADLADEKPDTVGKRIFVPEDIYFAMRTTGVSGRYSCFDACYETLRSRRRNEDTGERASAPVEIYIDYPCDGVPGQTFEAMVLC